MDRHVYLLLLIVTIFVSCGPGTHERWERERSEVTKECYDQEGFTADKVRCAVRRGREVDRKYSVGTDVFDDAIAAYSIALAERVDRGELAGRDGHWLSTQFLAYIYSQRAQLAQQEAIRRAYDPMTYEGFWSSFWQNWNAQAAQPRSPICRTYSVEMYVYTDCN
jgi:hypothetical protein